MAQQISRMEDGRMENIMTLQQIDLWINNEDVATDAYFDVKDPGRFAETVARVAKGTDRHVHLAVTAAHDAFQLWRERPLRDRVGLLLAAADMLERDSGPLSELLVREHGLLLSATRGDLNRAVATMRDTADLAEAFFQPETYEDGESWVTVEKKPLGVIACIVPWNAPMVLTMAKLAPALVSGNTLVIKPSPFAPAAISVALRNIAQLFPAGAINVVHGDADVGTALTTHPLVRKVSFTGGGQVARSVMANAAGTFKKVNLELGGNDPAVILDDAKLEEIMPDLTEAIFRCSGQVCFNIKRVYVPEKMYDRFYNAMCDIVDGYKVGHGLNPEATFGPVNNANQFKFVQELVERTRGTSAKVAQLGKKVDAAQWDQGYYLLPSVVRDAEPGQEIVTCEQFGPVIPLVPYRSEEQAIRWANDTEYGLCSSVWSADPERALKVAGKIEAGTTFVNSHRQSNLGFKHTPFGGIKQSGIGWKRGQVGIAEYVDYHTMSYFK